MSRPALRPGRRLTTAAGGASAVEQASSPAPTATRAAALDVRGLSTDYRSSEGAVHAVDDVSFSVGHGETLCIVGESGSGKSATLMSILGLISPRSGRICAGAVEVEGRDLLAMGQAELRRVRGSVISLIAQDPVASLNPLHRVGDQIRAVIQAHRPLARAAAWDQAISLLDQVGVPEPSARARQYPHEFSGGMLQRAMIAMAIANGPKILLADEPTTALDVTIQAQILDLLKAMQAEIGTALVLVTHDLGVVAEIADRVLVMYAGRVVETGSVPEVFERPQHPYTAALLASLPGGPRRERLAAIPGQPPNLASRPSGCSFHPRCQLSAGRERCRTETPALSADDGSGARSACHFADELREHPIEAPRV